MGNRGPIRAGILGLLAGLITGVTILGLGGRLVMALVALVAGSRSDWTMGGTSEVLGFAGIIGGIGGVAFVAIRRLLPRSLTLQGVVYGVVCFLAVVGLRLPSVTRSAAAFERQLALIVLLFCGVFIAYGAALAGTVGRLCGPVLRTQDDA